MVDMGQYATLSEHEQRIKELEEKIEILHEWVQYFKTKLEEKDAES